MSDAECPCGSGKAWSSCCGPRLDGSRPAETCEALMRSRYSAFATGNAQYLAATHTAATTPDAQRALEQWARSVTWVGLSVDDAPVSTAEAGVVAFTAKYLEDGALMVLRERSNFVRREGRWLYVDGQGGVTEEKVERNAPCPCGSGRKFKQCHS